ncbi:hypothetical protein [Streptomyces sp. SID3343]|uniref:hypothetical protein n=1 Tax=Streptomyces sp. SID3343 TaxID=2690260 RepID=UPI0013680AD1|nr:hypothetical protein [Streptomyces sp. SID3343]MYW01166.1 hypothetical protein [Streptomyces sp. SID3343]MYW04154.1 hypothetical protein [Streptomyces sp. SID3343]
MAGAWRGEEGPERHPRPPLPSNQGLLPALRTGGEVAEPAPGPGPVEQVARIHAPGELPVGTSGSNREQRWDMLGPKTRERLEAQAGTTLAWWAKLDADEFVEAFVFGPLGACRAASVVREGKRVYLVERLRFEPDALEHRSLRSDPVGRKPSKASRLFRPRRPAGGGPPPARPAVVADLGLNVRDSGVLGNLPAEVQEFLQRPFLGDDQGVVAQWYYDEGIEAMGRVLRVVFALMGDRDVTFATGRRTLPRGASPDRARWELDYYHAPVKRPRTTP